jgi:hypothetical protein
MKGLSKDGLKIDNELPLIFGNFHSTSDFVSSCLSSLGRGSFAAGYRDFILSRQRRRRISKY